MSETSKYIDVDNALARIRGNKKLYIRMLGLFTQSKEFASLDEMLELEDYENAANVAHAIKGMTGNLSLTKLFETSMELMQQLRQGAPAKETLDAYQNALTETRRCVDEVIAELTK